MSNETKNAMVVLRKAMKDDEPGVPGSHAHGWHCNIAMACYDSMNAFTDMNHHDRHIIANDAASRFMKLCFDVETKAD